MSTVKDFRQSQSAVRPFKIARGALFAPKKDDGQDCKHILQAISGDGSNDSTAANSIE